MRMGYRCRWGAGVDEDGVQVYTCVYRCRCGYIGVDRRCR